MKLIYKTIRMYILFTLAMGSYALADGMDHSAKIRDNATTKVKDVRTLIKNTEIFHEKNISVLGEVDDILDDRTFTIESGGFFNNEIVVFMDSGSDKKLREMIKDNKKLIVRGNLKTISINQIEKDQKWKFSDEAKEEIRESKTFILASELESQLAE